MIHSLDGSDDDASTCSQPWVIAVLGSSPSLKYAQNLQVNGTLPGGEPSNSSGEGGACLLAHLCYFTDYVAVDGWMDERVNKTALLLIFPPN